MTRKIYEPAVQSAAYKRLMDKARRTNRERDSLDRQNRGVAPVDMPLSMQLRTAIGALACGVSMQDWDCVAEGLDILQHAELQVPTVKSSGIQ